MTTPSELLALAKLRARLHSPSMAIFATDDWKFAAKLDDLGCLAIRVNPAEDHGCDWSAVAGLHIILAQWRTPLASDSRLASAILCANPKLFETLRRSCWSDVVYDAEGTWTKNLKARDRRSELLVRLSLQ